MILSIEVVLFLRSRLTLYIIMFHNLLSHKRREAARGEGGKGSLLEELESTWGFLREIMEAGEGSRVLLRRQKSLFRREYSGHTRLPDDFPACAYLFSDFLWDVRGRQASSAVGLSIESKRVKFAHESEGKHIRYTNSTVSDSGWRFGCVVYHPLVG